jgi:formate dehydrogenase subunit gamma
VSTTTRQHTPVVTLLRFDVVQRTAHWVNSLAFGVLMFTAIPLYFGSFFGVVFPRHVIQMIHLWTGVFLPVPIVVSLVGPWGRRMRADIRRASVWTRREMEWMRTLGRTSLNADKFNPGQKANVIFTGAAVVVLFATGYILQWFRFFPVSWREGATFTHDLFAFLVFAVVTGHVYMALTHAGSLKSMITGTVDDRWAATNAAAWLEEERAGLVAPGPESVARSDRGGAADEHA